MTVIHAPFLHFVLIVLAGVGSIVPSAAAVEVELAPVKDASLYSYDFSAYNPALPSTYPKADGVSHIHVGDTNNNNGVQRGLIQFDFSFDESGIPADAVVTDVNLALVVADIPNRVLQRNMNYWVVAMQGLSQPWSEGAGYEQTPATPGDTTWFHTEYDHALHGQLGNTSGNEFQDFTAGNPGYWPAAGYFGQADQTDTEPGAGVGGPFDDAHALVFTSDKDIGDTVDWSNARMAGDVQAWITGTRENFGWIMVGEEWINETHTVIRPDNGQLAPASCKVDFYSIQSAGVYYTPPALQITYRLPQDLLPGDANADDSVDVSDLGILATYYGTVGSACWINGDFNNDNNVDVSDLGILATSYGTGSSLLASQSVPEASMLTLLISGLAKLFWRRRQ